MKIIRLFLVLPVLIVLLGLGACITSVGKKYYQLYLDTSELAAVKKGNIHPVDKVLLVEAVEVDDIYNDYRVVYRTSPFQLNYYSYHFWIKKPGKLIRDCIDDYLSKSNTFRKVISDYSEGSPDLLLHTAVHILEESDKPGVWFAHLKMDIEIKDFKSNQTVLSHSFDRHRRLSVKKVGRVPVSISRILKEELDKVIKKLASYNEN